MKVSRRTMVAVLLLCATPCAAQPSPLSGGPASPLPFRGTMAPAAPASPPAEAATPRSGSPIQRDAASPMQQDIVPTEKAAAAELFVTPGERRFFTLGLSLSQAAFAHAGVTRKAARLSHVRNIDAKVAGLAALAPNANTARGAAQDALAHAAALLPAMNAPADVSGSITRLSAQMAKPLALTGDAAAVAPLNADAARTLASLGEARQLSDLLNTPALKAWLKSPGMAKDEPVWYTEGVLAGITEAASMQQLPDLLPPTSDLATDLRGLRDWLAGRLPESPTPEQSALQDALSGFLQGTARKAPVSAVSAAQLHALGDISRMLQAQMLPPQAMAAQ